MAPRQVWVTTSFNTAPARRQLAQNCVTASPTRSRPARSVQQVSNDPRHRLGRLGEHLAAEHLVRRGFQILERNYRTRWGELDIVAFDGETLCFCEVKTRRLAPGSVLGPFDSIRAAKRSRVRRMAGSWMAEHTERAFARAIRCDAIGVTFDRGGRLVSLDHLEGAF
jgi:putative endonuclease